MVDQAQAAKCLSKEEINNRISLIRQHLDETNRLYGELCKQGVFAYYYIGPNMTQTNLPDKCIFKRNIVENFD